ncbi:MAG: T9SS type A sorting domain-containing protein [Ignavibacteriaceae bacterium]
MRKLTYFLLFLLFSITLLPQDGGVLYPGYTNLRFKGKINGTIQNESFIYLGIKALPGDSGYVAGTGPVPDVFDVRFVPNNLTYVVRGMSDPANYIGIQEHRIRVLAPASYDTIDVHYNIPDFICIEVRDVATGNLLITLRDAGIWQVPPPFTQKDLDLKVIYNIRPIQSSTLLSPLNDACLFNPVQLEWGYTGPLYIPNCYPVFRRLQLATDINFTNLIKNDANAISPYPITPDLAPGTYFWRVISYRTRGVTILDTAISAVRRFTIANSSNFGLLTPLDGAICVGLKPTFTWSGVAGCTPSSIKYQIQVFQGTNTTPVINVSNLTTTSYISTTSLLQYTSYRWKVTATAQGGNSVSTSEFTFLTGGVPAKVLLTTPVNNATGVTLTPTLDWQSLVGCTPATYNIIISKQPDLSSPIVSQSGLTADQYTVAANLLTQNTKYYWQVTALNIFGLGTPSDIWNFTTGFGPAVVNLVTPANGDTCTALAPVFVWQPVAGTPPVKYIFVLADNQNFVNPIYFVDTTANSVAPPVQLQLNKYYYWVVTAYNIFGQSTSLTYMFRTGDIPTKATLSAPINNVTCLVKPITFSWVKGAGCSPLKSTLQISTSQTFATIAYEKIGILGSSWTVPATDTTLKNGTLYYWRVVMVNNFGSNPSVSRAFTLGIAPAKINLIGIANNSTCAPVNPVFNWNPVSNCPPISYRLQVSANQGFTGTLVLDTSMSVYSYSMWKPLNETTVYFWRVSSSNSIGAGVWSDIWTFTTGGKPEKITLSVPLNNEVICLATSVTLKWSKSVACTPVTYKLQVYKNSTIGTPYKEIVVPDTFFTWTFTPLDSFYWKVTASNSFGAGVTSDIWKFKMCATPQTPVLVSPCQQNNISNTGVIFTWRKAQYATHYMFKLYQELNPTPIITATVTDTQYTASSIPLCTKYTWTLAAYNPYDTSAIASCTFSTSCPPMHGNLWLIDHPVGTPVVADTFKLTFGIDPNATDGIDLLFGEFNATVIPAPISGYFNLPVAGNPKSFKEFRDTADYIVWRYKFTPKKYPMLIYWNLNTLPTDGDFTMRGYNNPNVGNINMRTVNYFNVTDASISELEIVYSKRRCVDVTLKHGFQFVSVPLRLDRMRNYQGAFTPDALNFYIWDQTATGGTGNYFLLDTTHVMQNGTGYLLFMNLPAPPYMKTIQLCGLKVPDTTKIYVKQGWNLFGIFNQPVALAKLKPSATNLLSTGIFYKYFDSQSGQVYDPVTTTFDLGAGYWVKANSSGYLYIDNTLAGTTIGTVSNVAILKVQDSWAKLIVTNPDNKVRNLYIKTDDNKDVFELPPAMPSQVFDARFADDTYAQNLDKAQRIRISGDKYPITLKAEGMDLEIRDALTNGKKLKVSLRNGESFTLTNSSYSEILVSKLEIPAEFTLTQNYPNPFNPTTMIKFGIPVDSKVSLKVFDMLGQEMKEIFSGDIKTGYHEIEFNASGLATGMYIYRIEAKGVNGQDFFSTKKMLLIK